VSPGLVHTLLCTQSAKDAYGTLYVHLKKVGVGSGVRTFVYPQWVRDIVRVRFSTTGAYDDQYHDNSDCYYVTEVDLSEAEFDEGDCCRCSEPFPPTP